MPFSIGGLPPICLFVCLFDNICICIWIVAVLLSSVLGSFSRIKCERGSSFLDYVMFQVDNILIALLLN